MTTQEKSSDEAVRDAARHPARRRYWTVHTAWPPSCQTWPRPIQRRDLLGLFILIFGLWVPSTFLTSTTITAILSAQAITAVVALAVLVPLAGGAYDLSVGSGSVSPAWSAGC